MNLWRWVRSRRWWIQALFALTAAPVILILLFVVIRTLQFAAAEHDVGVYVPSGANVVLRARGLGEHVRRIKGSAGWRAIDRRVLRDAVLRRQINGFLKDAGAPTLDELEDERKPFAKNQERALDLLGDDVVAALEVRDSIPKAPFLAIVRLRWLYYLAAPFAGLVLPSESIDGQRCFAVASGPQVIRAAVAGSLAIVSNDKALLQEALRRRGREEESDRPVAGRMVFEGSPGLLRLRKAIQDSGVMPAVKWETARGVSFSADLREATASFEATVDRAEPLHPDAPPMELRAWAPVASTGVILSNTGGADLMAWLAGLAAGMDPRDSAAKNLKDALQTLDDGGLKSALLPQLRDGMGVVTGLEEREGRSYATFVLLLPSRDPAAAVEALNGMVHKISGNLGDSKYFSSVRVGEVTLNSWSWPEGLQKSMRINDLLSPTYGAVKDVLVIGNNMAFTTQVVEAALNGGGFEETSEFRKLRARLREEGFGTDPSLSGGFFLPPYIRVSLDGTLPVIAKQLVYGSLNAAAVRTEVEAELRRRGAPTEAEIVKAFNEAIDRKVEEQEAALKRNLEPLSAIRWAAFEARTMERGIRIRAALEVR